jgi:hypothetical protein
MKSKGPICVSSTGAIILREREEICRERDRETERDGRKTQRQAERETETE